MPGIISVILILSFFPHTGWPYVHIYWEISWALACCQHTHTHTHTCALSLYLPVRALLLVLFVLFSETERRLHRLRADLVISVVFTYRERFHYFSDMLSSHAWGRDCILLAFSSTAKVCQSLILSFWMAMLQRVISWLKRWGRWDLCVFDYVCVSFCGTFCISHGKTKLGCLC